MPALQAADIQDPLVDPVGVARDGAGLGAKRRVPDPYTLRVTALSLRSGCLGWDQHAVNGRSTNVCSAAVL